MKSNILVIVIMAIFIISCNDKKVTSKLKNTPIVENVITNDQQEGYTLLKNNCYACHSVISKSHDEIIAPPLVAVKRRYKTMYSSKEDFIEAWTDWTLDPTGGKALMRGAVKQFNIMPKQPFNKEEVIKIAEYVFENELEAPEWFAKHFEEEHPNGMGKGQGRGMRNN